MPYAVDTLASRGLPPVIARPDLACTPADAELFQPGPGGSYSAARAICARCPARDDCLDWALDTGQRNGLWGGLDPDERHQLRPITAARATRKRGEMTPERAAEVRRQAAAGVRYAVLAARYDIGVKAIADIVNNRTWRTT